MILICDLWLIMATKNCQENEFSDPNRLKSRKFLYYFDCGSQNRAFSYALTHLIFGSVSVE